MWVVLYGPVCVGKTTLLTALARQLGAPVEDVAVPPLFGDPPRHHRGLLVTVDCGSGSLDLVTQGGPAWGEEQWRHVFAGADAVMLVLDAQPEREEANRRCMNALRLLTPVETGCVVISKAELVSQAELDRARRLPSLAGLPSQWPVFSSRSDRPATMLEPFDWLIEYRASRRSS